MPVDEAALPGRDTMAHFNVLLDVAAVDALRAAAPVDLGRVGDFFEARRGSAAAIHDALRLAYDDEQVRVGTPGHDARALAGTVARSTAATFLRPLYADTLRIGRQQFTVGLFWSNLQAYSMRAVPRGLEVRLTAVEGGAHTFLQEFSAQPREIREERSGPFDFTAALAPGEAVMLLHDFRPMRGQQFVSASVWQAYRATDAQAQRIGRVRRADAWIALGPAGARVLADRATVWGNERTLKPGQVDARWTRRLDNGATVRLIGVGRPHQCPSAGGMPTARRSPTTGRA
jgi:hypothetical protein